MNKIGRKELSEVITVLNDLREIVSNIAEDEQDKFDNLPEGLQESEHGSKLEEAATTLEDVLSNFDEAIDNIEMIIE